MSRILIIEDNQTMREGLAAALAACGHEVEDTGSGLKGIEMFREDRPDLVISDLKMEPVGGFEVLKAVKAEDAATPVIIITAFGEIDTAVEAMKLGACDFLTKPFELDVLEVRVAKALELSALRQSNDRLAGENAYLREEEGKRFDPRGMVGRSATFKAVLDRLARIAPTDSTVMILGESGTGKELLARAIHRQSARAERPFIKVQCGALAEGILESELFGHEKGAFTGATRRKIGRFELADSGTLFLDEIGDLSPLIQQKLLRVLQEREFERVGGDRTLKVDIRLITATHKDMAIEVKEGRFREDLFYRLHVVPLHLPPLRNRKQDIPELAKHFIEKLRDRTRSEIRSIATDALDALSRHDWPGNIRELENVIEQSLVMADGDTLRAAQLPGGLGGALVAAAHAPMPPAALPPSPNGGVNLNDALEGYERSLLVEALAAARGSKTEMARRLGIKTSALYYKLEKYGLRTPGDPEAPEADNP